MKRLVSPEAEALLCVEDAGFLLDALVSSHQSPAGRLLADVDQIRLRRRLLGVRVTRAEMLLASMQEAMAVGHSVVGAEHLVLGLVHIPAIRTALDEEGLSRDSMRLHLSRLVGGVAPDVNASAVRYTLARLRRLVNSFTRRDRWSR